MFVVGLPRSGTTLLAHLLAGGSGLLTLSEPFLVHSVVAHWRLKRYFSAVKKSACLRWAPPPPKDADEDELLSYLKNLAGENRLSTLIIKETYRVASNWDNVALLDEIASNYPVAAIIRHPVDVAVSSIRSFHWCRGTIGRLLRLWARDLPLFADDRALVEHIGFNWSRFVQWCRRHAAFTVLYEDLVSDPRSHLKALCEVCDLPFDEKMIDDHPRAAFGGIGDPTVVHQPRPVHKESVGRSHLLSPELHETLTRICGSTMNEVGYS